ncbi:MAG: DUF58 domain-containing protein [Microbacteriaceae bacterium]
MTGLLRRVRTTLSIRARRPVAALLDGEYASVFHGRSLDFDDLRPYVAGDELRDVDWRASARTGTLMTRRFVARRQHTLVLLVETGRAMAARAAGGEPKRDVAILAAGVLGYLAVRNGDRVGMLSRSGLARPATGEAALERMLQTAHAEIDEDAPPSDLAARLADASRLLGRGRLLAVVADDAPLGDDGLALVRRLAARHELLWVTVADADLTDPALVPAGMRDIESAVPLPGMLRGRPALRAEFARSVAEAARARAAALDRLGVANARIASSADAVPALLTMIREHGRGR